MRRRVSAHLPRRTGIVAMLAKGPHHKLIWSINPEVSALDSTVAAGIVARVMSILLSRIQTGPGAMLLRTLDSIPRMSVNKAGDILYFRNIVCFRVPNHTIEI